MWTARNRCRPEKGDRREKVSVTGTGWKDVDGKEKKKQAGEPVPLEHTLPEPKEVWGLWISSCILCYGATRKPIGRKSFPFAAQATTEDDAPSLAPPCAAVTQMAEVRVAHIRGSSPAVEPWHVNMERHSGSWEMQFDPLPFSTHLILFG